MNDEPNVSGANTYRLDNLVLGTVQPTLSCIDLLNSTPPTKPASRWPFARR